MGTSCASLVADVVLFCYKRVAMVSFLTIIKLMLSKLLTLSQDIWMLDDLLYSDHHCLKQMVCQIYPTEFQLTRLINLILKPKIGL